MAPKIKTVNSDGLYHPEEHTIEEAQEILDSIWPEEEDEDE
jgi:hypothetical protein